MDKLSDKVIKFIAETMNYQKMELTPGGKRLAEQKIQGGLFQGDAQPQITQFTGIS